MKMRLLKIISDNLLGGAIATRISFEKAEITRKAVRTAQTNHGFCLGAELTFAQTAIREQDFGLFGTKRCAINTLLAPLYRLMYVSFGLLHSDFRYFKFESL